jgi:hypothetical protein
MEHMQGMVPSAMMGLGKIHAMLGRVVRAVPAIHVLIMLRYKYAKISGLESTKAMILSVAIKKIVALTLLVRAALMIVLSYASITMKRTYALQIVVARILGMEQTALIVKTCAMRQQAHVVRMEIGVTQISQSKNASSCLDFI